ncbi:hypothetical protein LguiB_003062 [Lonicera macranthoides]
MENNMVQTLEAIRGGGGSIKAKVLEPGGVTTANIRKPIASVGESSTSCSSNSINLKCPEIANKSKHNTGKPHQIPMLNSGNISFDGTPSRRKPNKKGLYNIVEIVDIKCGSPDRTWASPVASRLKKLGFSKLSQTIA